MIKKLTIATTALFLCVASNSLADQKGVGEGSVFVPPVHHGHGAGDMEIETDLPMFVSRGYETPNWKVHEKFVADVVKELVLPDYNLKTGGKATIDDGVVEIASAYITGGDYNDLLVVSRLPGECGAEGCTHQVWRYDGIEWRKVFEVRALALAYKDDQLVAIGDEEYPTAIYRWDGLRFSR